MRLASLCLSLVLHLGVVALLLYLPPSAGLHRVDLQTRTYTVELVRLVRAKPKLAAHLPRVLAKKGASLPRLIKIPRNQAVVRVKQPVRIPGKKVPDKNLAKKPAKKKKVLPRPTPPDPKKILARALGEARQKARQEARRENDILAKELASLQSKLPQSGGREKGSAPGQESGTLLAVYASLVKEKIKSNWRFVSMSPDMDLQAEVAVAIDHGGRILSYKMIRSSGSPAFDASIKKAIEETDTLPEPPGQVRNIVITFNANELD